MRLFIAVPASDDVRAEAASLLEALKSSGADCKWAEPVNLHWTLHFFGETAPSKLSEIGEALRRAAAACAPFEAQLGAAGAFPSAQAPKILWLGLRRGAEGFSKLAERLFAALAERGYPLEDRPFHPHLTLGRLRSARGLSALKRAVEGLAGGAKMRVDRLVLYESRLGLRGPAYFELDSAALAGDA